MLSHLRHDNGKGFPTSSFLQPGLSHSCRFGLLELSLALLTVSAGSAPAADLGRCGYSACRVSSSQSDLGANVGSSSSSAAIISPLHFGSALRTAMAARISSIVLRSASCLQHSSTASLRCGIHLRKVRGPYRDTIARDARLELGGRGGRLFRTNNASRPSGSSRRCRRCPGCGHCDSAICITARLCIGCRARRDRCALAGAGALHPRLG